jgi:light-regulated signal transduction histidine kinase (bacteriophytochrome)
MSIETEVEEAELQEAIANCDKEPIHIPGTTQTFGVVLATDAKLNRIEFASETTQQYLGIAATDLLGQPMDSLLDELLMHSARNMLTRASSSHQRHVVGERVFGNTMFQVSVYGKDGRAVLDFLPYPTATRTDSSALERARVLLTESTAHDSVEDVLAAAVESLRTTTRFDRVKAYRFLPDNSGEVVAESRASHMESYMGLRFPATDIPPVARELYVKTPIRVMADVHASDATLLALDPDARPLDLSLSILRGSSGVHVQYLKNMGVKSTLTLPIVVEGKLWGLFSLHHNKPLVPEPTALIAAELTGKMLGLILQHAKHTRHLRRLSQSISFAHELFSANVGAPFENSHTSSPLPSLSDLIQVDGLAVVGAGKVYSDGTVPSVDACQAIVGLASRSSDQLFLADDLRAQLPDTHLGDSAGVLRMNVDARKKVSLLLFRGLSVRQTSWAGVPQKSLTRSALGPQLNPRKSFASYVESVEGKCDEWSNDDLEVAVALQSALIQVFSVQSELKDGRDRANLLVHELNHRVRNILTLVQSLSSSSRASATSLEGYATSLEERIAALATAHDLLTDGDLRGVSFARMARVELHPFIQGEDEDEGARAELQGPEISLKPDAAQVMALVLHELTSNSVKYGSLSVPQGRVSLVWEKSDRGVIISWSESGGPHVTTPEREGFGRSIIENAIPHELGGEASIDFMTTGVGVRLLLPEAALAVESLVEPERTADVETPNPDEAISDGSVMILEDNYVIANEMKSWFRKLGFRHIVTVSTVMQALQKLRDERFDFCMLDVNIRGEWSKPVASRLTELGAPFAFASGYGAASAEICQSFEAPLLTKPITINEIRGVLINAGALPA